MSRTGPIRPRPRRWVVTSICHNGEVPVSLGLAVAFSIRFEPASQVRFHLAPSFYRP